MERHFPELRRLKGCVSFIIGDPFPGREPEKKHYLIRDPAGIEILGRIAAGLTGAGYRVTEAKPAAAIGYDAAFYCRLNGFLEVDLELSISGRHGGLMNCVLWSNPWRPIRSYFFLQRTPTDSKYIEQFQGLALAINDQLVNRLGAASVTWVTEREMGGLLA